jgi:hypothetical protein
MGHGARAGDHREEYNGQRIMRSSGAMFIALSVAVAPAVAAGEPLHADRTVLAHKSWVHDEQLPGVLPELSSPVVAGYWGSDEEIRNARVFVYSVLGVTGFTILFNGTYAATRKRAPTSVRVLGGVLGTIELVPGVLLLIYPDDRDAGAILTSLGGAAVLAALLSGGKEQDRTVLVAPTSDGGAVMSMSWRF